MKSKWTKENLINEALKYNSRIEFQKNSKSAYNAAWKSGILNNICSHMNSKQHYWTNEELKQEALKYNKKIDFKTHNPNAYNAISRRNLSHFMNHMKAGHTTWTSELLKSEALKYKSKIEFQKNNRNAYASALSRGIINEICFHMKPLKNYALSKERNTKNNEEIKQEALKYHTRKEFSDHNPNTYNVARRRNILDQVCEHMPVKSPFSKTENGLFNLIKQKFPKTQKLRDHKVKITNKPYIHGLDIDIYIPELRKGIEFDGSYWHSEKGLKYGRPNWPDSDLKNYHQIKDDYFKSKGIEILHIKEKDWLENKDECFKKCLEFLENANGRR